MDVLLTARFQVRVLVGEFFISIAEVETYDYRRCWWSGRNLRPKRVFYS
jgi:hypothetical protein